MAEKGKGFTVARDLGPSDAPEAHAALTDWLGRRVGDATLDLADGDGPVSPLALQLLAAAARSAAHPDIPFGPTADAALADMEKPKTLETQPR